MAIGDSAYLGYQSFLSIGKETTFGTKTDNFSFIEFMSESLKAEIDRKSIETIHTSRNPIKRVSLNKSVGGTIEAPLNVAADGVVYMIRQAMGGTSAVATIGASLAYNHTIYEGDMENNASSAGASSVKGLCAQVRKGAQGAGSGTTFDVVGMRVNNLTIKAEQGDMAMVSAEIVGKGMSITSSTPTAVYSNEVPILFSGVKVEMGVSIGAALTERYFQSFELSINNNLTGDAIVRRLGSDEIQILPPGMRDVSLKLTGRWDTTTNYDEWLADTTTAIQLTLTGPSITAGGSTYSMIIKLPDCYLESDPMPEVGSTEILQNELNYKCIQQNSTTGYAVQMVVTNLTTNYDG